MALSLSYARQCCVRSDNVRHNSSYCGHVAISHGTIRRLASTDRLSTLCYSSDSRAAAATATDAGGSNSQFNWLFDLSSPQKPDPKVQDIPVAAIRRPLGRTRSNDQAKVEALMKSIQEIGLQEPIDVLLVDGVYYGFSGCHRFEAHQRLGLPTIKCRVRKANKQVLKMHMM